MTVCVWEGDNLKRYDSTVARQSDNTHSSTTGERRRVNHMVPHESLCVVNLIKASVTPASCRAPVRDTTRSSWMEIWGLSPRPQASAPPPWTCRNLTQACLPKPHTTAPVSVFGRWLLYFNYNYKEWLENLFSIFMRNVRSSLKY